jgi:hypothetical protein
MTTDTEFNIDRTAERIKKTGEVFTPTELVNEILDKLPPEIWYDPTKTFLDPTCGDGQFLVEVKKRLMVTLAEKIPDTKEREGHILDKMIYGVDLMKDNVMACRYRLGLPVTGNKGNIVRADGLLYDYEFTKIGNGYYRQYVIDARRKQQEERRKKKEEKEKNERLDDLADIEPPTLVKPDVEPEVVGYRVAANLFEEE